MPGKKRGPGRPFTANDPRRLLAVGLGGRPKKSVTWKEAEDALREAIPRLLLMSADELKKLLEKNPTGAERLAADYIRENVAAAVDKFLGKTATPITGKEGAPLIPSAPLMDVSKFTVDELLKIIEATK